LACHCQKRLKITKQSFRTRKNSESMKNVSQQGRCPKCKAKVKGKSLAKPRKCPGCGNTVKFRVVRKQTKSLATANGKTIKEQNKSRRKPKRQSSKGKANKEVCLAKRPFTSLKIQESKKQIIIQPPKWQDWLVVMVTLVAPCFIYGMMLKTKVLEGNLRDDLLCLMIISPFFLPFLIWLFGFVAPNILISIDLAAGECLVQKSYFGYVIKSCDFPLDEHMLTRDSRTHTRMGLGSDGGCALSILLLFFGVISIPGLRANKQISTTDTLAAVDKTTGQLTHLLTCKQAKAIDQVLAIVEKFNPEWVSISE